MKLWLIYVMVLLLAWFPCMLSMIFGEHNLDIMPPALLGWCPSRGIFKRVGVCHCQENFLRFLLAFGSSNDIRLKSVTK